MRPVGRKRKTGGSRWRIAGVEGLIRRLVRPFAEEDSRGIGLEELRYLTHAIRLRADRLYEVRGRGSQRHFAAS